MARRRLRILFVLSDFPALTETFILSQITGLLDRGHEVDIFAESRADTGGVQAEVEYGLEERTTYPAISASGGAARLGQGLRVLFGSGAIPPIPCLRSLNMFRYGRDAQSLRLLAAAASLHGRDRYDIVHCHFGPSGILGSRLLGAGAVRGVLVCTFYGYDVSSYVRRKGTGIYRGLFSAGALFLALSEHMKERLVGLGCDRRRVVVHHLAVEPEDFTVAAREEIEGQPLQIVTVGRLAEKKGIEFALRAVARLISDGVDLRLKVVGDGPLRRSLEELAHELAVGGCVQFLGWRSRREVRRLLAEANIFLLPSVTARNGDEEGTPTVLLEAMASGLPVVSTLHAGIPEQVTDGVHGYLVPERDAPSLAERLRDLSGSAGLRTEMGRRGRQRVEEEFSIDRQNDTLVELYRGLVESG